MSRMVMRLSKVILNTLQRVPNANLLSCKSWIQEQEYHQSLDHSACFEPSSENKGLSHTKISTKVSFVPLLIKIICRSHCFGCAENWINREHSSMHRWLPKLVPQTCETWWTSVLMHWATLCTSAKYSEHCCNLFLQWLSNCVFCGSPDNSKPPAVYLNRIVLIYQSRRPCGCWSQRT